MTEASAIEQRGWRQWSFVASADAALVRKQVWMAAGADPGDAARVLIVTQDCDLVHDSYANEPAVDAYFCAPIEGPVDGNLTAAKNPRTLLVSFEVEGEPHWFRLQASWRILFSRRLLESLTPDPALRVPDGSVQILQRWLINRIFRTGLPTVFNDRTRQAQEQMKKLLRKEGAPLMGLYIDVQPWSELPPDETYRLNLVGLVAFDLALDTRAAMEGLLGNIALGFERSDGIGACDYQVLGEDELTLSMLRIYRLLPLDYLSLSGKSGGELPPLP